MNWFLCVQNDQTALKTLQLKATSRYETLRATFCCKKKVFAAKKVLAAK